MNKHVVKMYAEANDIYKLSILFTQKRVHKRTTMMIDCADWKWGGNSVQIAWISLSLSRSLSNKINQLAQHN